MKSIIVMITLLSAMSNLVIFDFNTDSKQSQWEIVNDNVMGGKSTGSVSFATDGTAVFEGRISLENNGGFASLRFDPGSIDIEKYERIVLLVNSHGKPFQFRAKRDQNGAHSYISYFTTAEEWQKVEIPLQNLYPSYRGRKLSKPNFSGRQLEEIGFLFGNKKAEAFRLEIRRITLE